MPPPYPITGRPHRKLCGRLFFVPGRRRAGGGLSAGRFVYGMVCLRDCLRDCLWDGQFAAPESFQGRGQGRNRGTGQGNGETGKRGNRETGKQGNRETGKQGNRGGSPVGQWSVSGRIGRPVGGRFAGRMFPGRGEWPFLRSPKYLRRISCTVRNNPVYLQVRTEEANR